MAGLTLADILGRSTPDLINYPPQGTVQGAYDRYGRPVRSRFGAGGGASGQTIPLSAVASLLAGALPGRPSGGVNPATGGFSGIASPWVQHYPTDPAAYGERAHLTQGAWDHHAGPDDERELMDEAQARQEAILQMLLQMARQQGMGGR